MSELVSYAKYRRTRLYVDLNAPPQERWSEAAEIIGDELHEISAEVVGLVEDGIDDGYFSAPLAWVVKQLAIGGAFVGARVIGMVAGMFGQEYQNEILGLAEAVDLPYTHLLLANLMYDLTQIHDYHSPNACSSYSTTIGGQPVLVRNMDWAWPESIGRHTVMVEFYRGNRSYRSVGIVGMVGVLSAMYSNRWAVTLNQAPVNVTGIRYSQLPALQQLRSACDRFGTFRHLANRIQDLQTMSPFFAHVVGIEPDEQLVINGFGDSYLERGLEQKRFLVQTNHFVGEESEDYNPEDYLEQWDTGERYDVISRRLKKQCPRSLKAAWNVMRSAAVTHEATMQSMVLCPARNQLQLKVRI